MNSWKRFAVTNEKFLHWVEYPDDTRGLRPKRNGDIAAVDVTRPGQTQHGLVSSVTYHPFGQPSAIAYTAGRVQQRPLYAVGKPQSVTDVAATQAR